ncbi:MAG: hypothetical protein HQK79_22280 [Desulfobacterales bacterium]|nr:hypothetical protein [Desulfobacterales bacterium]
MMQNDITNLQILNISDETIKVLFGLYVEIVEKIIEKSGLIADIIISNTAFCGAMFESQKDFVSLSHRRLPEGISEGKIAGVFVFRLSRWNIISLPENLSEDQIALKFNYLSSLAFGLKLLKINVANLPGTTGLELQYVLTRRHMNQETLGLCFDLIKAYS